LKTFEGFKKISNNKIAAIKMTLNNFVLANCCIANSFRITIIKKQETSHKKSKEGFQKNIVFCAVRPIRGIFEREGPASTRGDIRLSTRGGQAKRQYFSGILTVS
jgi:hypothetical protein